jgi:hypothetical protein
MTRVLTQRRRHSRIYIWHLKAICHMPLFLLSFHFDSRCGSISVNVSNLHLLSLSIGWNVYPPQHVHK